MPEWVRGLDETTIRSIIKHHLASKLPNPLHDGSLDISFFAEGAFNKLYLISYAGHQTEYLLRVTLPVEPYFKTESEVATLMFLSAKTSVPVARVVAWDSNSDNELGFEWLLMERVKGVTLDSVWRRMSWQDKHVLTADIAEMIRHLRTFKFDRIGSLYFESALRQKPSEQDNNDNSIPRAEEEQDALVIGISTCSLHSLEKETQIATTSDNTGVDKEGAQEDTTLQKTSVELTRRAMPPKRYDYNNLGDFTIGPSFDEVFYMDDRVYLLGDRGPYQNSHDMLKAEIEMQLEWVRNGRSMMHSQSLLDETGYCDDFEREAPIMEALSHEYLDILPQIYQHGEPGLGYVLHHHDLNPANILVDPDSYKITGIVDWEMANVVPIWRASVHPVFLQNIDFMHRDEVEPPIPSYEHEHDEDIDVFEQGAIEERDRWESKQLRSHFDNTMKTMAADDNDTTADDEWHSEIKRNFKHYVGELTNNTGWARLWLQEYRDGVGGLKRVEKQMLSDAELAKLVEERTSGLRDGKREVSGARWAL